MERGVGALLKGLMTKLPEEDPPKKTSTTSKALPRDSNMFLCEVCGLSMEQQNKESHLKGKKHTIQYIQHILGDFEFWKLLKKQNGCSTIVELFNYIFEIAAERDLQCMFGLEHFVECHNNEGGMTLFHRASGSCHSLPLYNSDPGELEKNIEVMKRAYSKFIGHDILSQSNMFHSLRTSNFTKFKEVSNWPWIETENDLPQERRAFWRKLELIENTNKIKETCVEIAKNISKESFGGFMNSIQVVGEDELDILKAETKKRISDFYTMTKHEQTKLETKTARAPTIRAYLEKASLRKKGERRDEGNGENDNIIPKRTPPELRKHDHNLRNPIPESNGVTNIPQQSLVTPPRLAKPIQGLTKPSPLRPQMGQIRGHFPPNQIRNGNQRHQMISNDLPPPPQLNIDLEEAARNLTKMGQKLSGAEEKKDTNVLETKELKILRELLGVAKELDTKIEKLKSLADREKSLREREHKPIAKLLSVLETSKTAITTDFYFLFAKANMKYRPRTIKIEADKDTPFGFRIQQTRIGGKRIYYFSSVTERSPSAKAGLCQGDRLVELNEHNVENYDYDELISKISEASAIKNGRKQLIFLLSDPETDEYLLQSLNIPVMRFQVKSHVDNDAIAKEWFKFRKKHKSSKKGFYTDTGPLKFKLDTIQPRKPPKPPVVVEEKAPSPPPAPLPEGPPRRERVPELPDDPPALNYERGGGRRPLSKLITELPNPPHRNLSGASMVPNMGRQDHSWPEPVGNVLYNGRPIERDWGSPPEYNPEYNPEHWPQPTHQLDRPPQGGGWRPGPPEMVHGRPRHPSSDRPDEWRWQPPLRRMSDSSDTDNRRRPQLFDYNSRHQHHERHDGWNPPPHLPGDVDRRRMSQHPPDQRYRPY